MAADGQGLSIDSSLHSVTISSLQDKLELAAEGANWEYAIFWQPHCPAGDPAGCLSWGGGCFNGPPATGREALVPSLDLIRERKWRRTMLHELREEILSTNADTQKINIARSKLSAPQWFYLMTSAFTFPANSGMPGNVFSQQKEVWLRNAGFCDTGKFTRAEMAKVAGIQTLLFLPVNGGVLELGNTDDVEEDCNLTQFLRNAFDETAIRIIEGAASAIIRLASSDQTPRSPSPSPPSPKQQMREFFQQVSTRSNPHSPSPPNSPHEPGYSSVYGAFDSRQVPQAKGALSPSSLSLSPLSPSSRSPSSLSPSPLSPSPLFHIPVGSHPSDYITMVPVLPSFPAERTSIITPSSFLLQPIEPMKDHFQPPNEFGGLSLNSPNLERHKFHRGRGESHGLSFTGTVLETAVLGINRERFGSEGERLGSERERWESERERFGSEAVGLESETERFGSERERFGSETLRLESETERFGGERERFRSERKWLGSERERLGIPQSSIHLNQTEVVKTQQMDIAGYWSTEPSVQMGNSLHSIFVEGNNQENSSTLSPFGTNISEGIPSVLQPHSNDLWGVRD